MFAKAVKLMLPITLGMLLAGGAAVPAAAQSAAAVSPEFTKRASDFTAFINGDLAPEKFFAADLLANLPMDKIKAHNASIVEKMGKAVGVGTIEAKSSHEGIIAVKFEKGELKAEMRVEDKEPHRVNGVRFAPPAQ